MKIYKTIPGIVIEKENKFYLIANETWDSFINDDSLLQKSEQLVQSAAEIKMVKDIIAPIGNNQELWACGVTYLRSKEGRQSLVSAAGKNI